MAEQGKHGLTLPYLPEFVSQDIDLEQLRPNKSYDHLIENRNASLAGVLGDPEKLAEFLRPRACPNCGGERAAHLLNKDGLDIVSCETCGLVFVNPVFDEDKYREIYRSEEYQEIVQRLGEDSHAYRRRRFGCERMDVIERFHAADTPKRLLEIGCSTGFVLEEAVARGWSATGLELNPSAAGFARERGLDVREERLEDVRFAEPFSAVALYDVLEHLFDPGAVMRQVLDRLAPGGTVFLYVPNWNSASRALLGEENAHFIWPTHHLTYFTPETLRDFLERRGLEVLHWETQGLDLADWLWFLEAKTGQDTEVVRKHLEYLQFAVNAAGHGKNLRMYARKAS